MLPPSLLPELAVRSRNFNLLLLAPPADRPAIATHLLEWWPAETKAFLIRHRQLAVLTQLSTTYTQRDLVVALGTGSVAVIDFLRRQGLALPAASMDWAAGFGSLEVLEYLEQLGQRPTEVAVTRAARRGHLEVVRWLTTPATATHPAGGVPATKEAMATAAQGGHLTVLEYLAELGVVADERAAMLAAGTGRLDVLRWLYNHGVKFGVGTYTLAAANDDPLIAKYLESLPGDPDGSLAANGLEDHEDLELAERRVHTTAGADVITWAARLGQLDALDWYLPDREDPSDSLFQSEDPPGAEGLDELNQLMTEVDVVSYPATLTELLRRGAAPTSVSLRAAAEHGQLDEVRRQLERDPRLPVDQALEVAITRGHRAVVELLLRDHPTLTSRHLALAVDHGERELEELFRRLGVPEDFTVLSSYAGRGRLDDVKRVLEGSGGPGLGLTRSELYKLLREAASSGNPALVEFLLYRLGVLGRDSDEDTDEAKQRAKLYTSAAINGQAGLIRWLLENLPITTGEAVEQAFTFALELGYLNVMELLVEYLPAGTVFSQPNVNHLEVVQFLVQHRLVNQSFPDWLAHWAVISNYRSLTEAAVALGHVVVGMDVDRAAINHYAALLTALYPYTTQRCSRGAYLIAERNGWDSITRLLRRAGFERARGAWFDSNDYEDAAAELENVRAGSREHDVILYQLHTEDGSFEYRWSSAWLNDH